MFMNSNSMPSSARTLAMVSKSTPVVSSQYSLEVTQEPVIMWMPKRVAPAAFARRYLARCKQTSRGRSEWETSRGRSA